jgi:hypothetical protein
MVYIVEAAVYVFHILCSYVFLLFGALCDLIQSPGSHIQRHFVGLLSCNVTAIRYYTGWQFNQNVQQI